MPCYRPDGRVDKQGDTVEEDNKDLVTLDDHVCESAAAAICVKS